MTDFIKRPLYVISPAHSEEPEWSTKPILPTLEKAWYYVREIVDKEIYRQIREYLAGGEPIDIITMFDIGTKFKHYSNDVRRCIKAMVYLVAAQDSWELGHTGRAVNYLDNAKALVAAVDKAMQQSRVVLKKPGKN